MTENACLLAAHRRTPAAAVIERCRRTDVRSINFGLQGNQPWLNCTQWDTANMNCEHLPRGCQSMQE